MFLHDPSRNHVVSILFLIFPVFLVVEDMAITRPLRPYGLWSATENTGNLRASLRETGNKVGTRLGTTENIFISTDLPIPPFKPVPLTLPVPQPALRPQATRGTNLVGLGPLRLRLAKALLEYL